MSIPKKTIHKKIPWNKGKKGIYKESTIQLWSEKRKGKQPWNKGIKHSTETKNKMSLKKLGKVGELSNAYKNGTSRNKHYLSNPQYKKWHDEVFKRDDHTCQNCGERGVYLEAHHIKSWAKFPELRFVVSNGITYCRECHIELDYYRSKFNKK